MLCRWFLCATFCRSLCSQYPFGLDIFAVATHIKKRKKMKTRKERSTVKSRPLAVIEKANCAVSPQGATEKNKKPPRKKRTDTRKIDQKYAYSLRPLRSRTGERGAPMCAQNGSKNLCLFFLRTGKKRREREKSTTGESTDAHPRMCATCANNSGRAPGPGDKGAGGPTGGRARSGRQCWSKYRR